jgi:hypothetical protein
MIIHVCRSYRPQTTELTDFSSTKDSMMDKITKLTFAQLVDMEQIQRLLESNYKITGILSAILDTEENILVAAGWQDLCTRYHRVNPEHLCTLPRK